MARKGQPKVKTGCSTCKTRKVKCDEARPSCLRCTKTGRKCDGYTSPPPGSYSWDELLCISRPITQTRRVEELRSLGFFNHMVAPALSLLVEPSFWTHLVTQAVQQDQAVMHAVVAISSLYENFDNAPALPAEEEDSLAISHYNRSIQQIVESKGNNADTVLIVCVLFVCIEFLRGDSVAAISHLQHGLNLLRLGRVDRRLASIFRHLSIFPLFFGGKLATIPALAKPAGSPAETCSSIDLAREMLDDMTSRAVRLVRTGDPYRLGMVNSLPSLVFLERRQLLRDLESWRIANESLEASEDESACLMLKTRWLACKIWASACLDSGKELYEPYVAEFEAIVNAAARYLEIQQSHGIARPKFVFDMGFAPLLFFVVLKCRNLRTRLSALLLMKALSSPRETLWEATTVYATGIRLIEIEHGIELTPETIDSLGAKMMDKVVPPDENRIRDSWCEEEYDIQQREDGTRMVRRRICFIVKSPSGGLAKTRDWITLQ